MVNKSENPCRADRKPARAEPWVYHCTKNQGLVLCVDGDMVILFFGSFHGKMTIFPPTHNLRTLNIKTHVRQYVCQHRVA